MDKHMKAFRERRQRAGLERCEVWAHPEDKAQIKALAAKLARRRLKAPCATVTAAAVIQKQNCE